MIFAPFKRISFTLRTLECLFWSGLAFVAAQRYSMPSVAVYVCLLPWVAAIFTYQSDVTRRNSFLLLALFWSVDNTLVEYPITTNAVRYLIYGTVLLSLTKNTTVRASGLVGTLLATLFYLATTLMFVNDGLSGNHMWRDCLILILVGITFSLQSKRPFGLDLELLMYAMTGYLLSECVNFFVFSGAWYGEYMNYDTTKYLIALPSLVALFARLPFLAFCLIALTVPVLVGYTHRTLFLAYIATVLISFMFFSLHKGATKRLLFLGGVILAAFMLRDLSFTSLFEANKALHLFTLAWLHGVGVFEILDPVRYASSLLYFQLPLFEILFGRGFGSGIADVNNVFGFVRPGQTAFTLQELNTNYFYNFHDVWVDISLRFGLPPFVAFLLWFIRLRPFDNSEGLAIWALTLIGISSAFYGTSGLLSIFFLIRVIQSYRADHA